MKYAKPVYDTMPEPYLARYFVAKGFQWDIMGHVRFWAYLYLSKLQNDAVMGLIKTSLRKEILTQSDGPVNVYYAAYMTVSLLIKKSVTVTLEWTYHKCIKRHS